MLFECCYAVARVFLEPCYVVARVFLECCFVVTRVFLECCFAVARVFLEPCYVVARVFLECCFVVTRVFLECCFVVTRVFLECCFAVARVFLEPCYVDASFFFFEFCFVVAGVFWGAFRLLLCGRCHESRPGVPPSHQQRSASLFLLDSFPFTPYTCHWSHPQLFPSFTVCIFPPHSPHCLENLYVYVLLCSSVSEYVRFMCTLWLLGCSGVFLECCHAVVGVTKTHNKMTKSLTKIKVKIQN